MGAGTLQPNFLVIGAGKAGTTSLYHYLAQHPEVFMSPAKEPKFFALAGHALDFTGPGDGRVRRGTTTTLEDYAALFEGAGRARAVGEASTIYLHHARAPGAIAQALPGVKLIAVLRQPADRAYSAFLHLTRDGHEPCARFEDALADEPRRIAAGWYYFWHYRARGYYLEGLQRYYRAFPAAQIRVYLYDDFRDRPVETLQDMFRFLEVDDGFVPDMSARHNVSGVARSARAQRWLLGDGRLKRALKTVVPEALGHRAVSLLQRQNLTRPGLRPELRAELTRGYRQDILGVEGLIGRDLSGWLLA